MIDYLNDRSSGLKPELPKPLNWAERALRTYSEKREASSRNVKTNKDLELLHTLSSSAHTYNVHRKTYIRKYTASSVLP